MRWGKEIKTLKEIWEKTGFKPKALIDRPRLTAADRPYLEAFYDISSGRPMAEDPPPLAASEILYYSDRVLGLGPSDRQSRFFRVMRILDAAYLDAVREKK